MPSLLNIFAAELSGIPGWQAYRYRWIPGTDADAEVTGCVPNGVYKDGPKEGRPTFSAPVPETVKTVIVRALDFNTWKFNRRTSAMSSKPA